MENPENYTKEKMTIDVVKANVLALFLIIPIFLIFILPYILIWIDDLSLKSFFKMFNESISSLGFSFLVFILICIGGIVLHELIHGIVWALYAKRGFKSIKFGVMWKMLTPYCHCKEPLKVKHYIVGALMPAIFLGIIPAILSWFTGSFTMLIFGVFFTMAAAGDFMIVSLIRKENKEDWVQDHPSEVGYFIYREIKH